MAGTLGSSSFQAGFSWMGVQVLASTMSVVSAEVSRKQLSRDKKLTARATDETSKKTSKNWTKPHNAGGLKEHAQRREAVHSKGKLGRNTAWVQLQRPRPLNQPKEGAAGSGKSCS